MAPNIWNQYAAAAAQQYGVPLEVVTSVIGAESSWRPNAVSGKGAGGLMQLMPDTFAEVRQQHGLGPDRMDPQTNINAGTAYLGQLYRQFGNWNDAVAAYNAGPNRWRQVLAGKQSAPRETTDYVAKVTAGFGKQGGTMPLFGGASGGISDADLRRMMGRSGGGLLEVDPAKNYAEGLGLLANWGQTESQPPRTEPEPGGGQTERMNVGSRINDIINSLIQPGATPGRMSRGQMMLGGAAGAMERLAGVHDRRVGLGEMLGALGGGVMRGGAAADVADREARAEQFAELGRLGQIQGHQRSEATAVAKVLAARQYAAQLRASGDPQKAQLAAAIENDPSLMDNIIVKAAESAFPKDGEGKVVPKGGSIWANGQWQTAPGGTVDQSGPLEGTGPEAQFTNAYIMLEQKRARGEQFTPQEQLLYETSRRFLSRPKVVTGADGVVREIAPEPLPTLSAPPAAAPPVTAPPAATPPPAAAAPPPVPGGLLEPRAAAPAAADTSRVREVVPPVVKPTNEQSLAAGFANRLYSANLELDQIEQRGDGVPSLYDRGVGQIPVLGNYLTTGGYQQMTQAQREFINAQLRRESGAAVSESEWENARQQYFPQPGDRPEVLAQKRRSRSMAIANMAQSAGPAKIAFTPPKVTMPDEKPGGGGDIPPPPPGFVVH